MSEGSDERASDQLYTPAEFRRDLRRFGWAVGITFAVTAGVFGSMVVIGGGEAWWVLAWPTMFALLAGSLVWSYVVLELTRRERATVGGDRVKLRELMRAIGRNDDSSLSDRDKTAAARLAQVSWVTQGYQFGSLTLTYLALILMQIAGVVSTPSNSIAAWLIAVLVATLIVFAPVTGVRMRRTRRYAIEHRTSSRERAHARDAVVESAP